MRIVEERGLYLINNNSDLLVEGIDYENLYDFIAIWNEGAHRLGLRIMENINHQLTHTSLTGNKRLVWLDMDMVLHGIPSLDIIRQLIDEELTFMLKNTNNQWKQDVTYKLIQHICTTSRIYFDTIRNYSVVIDHSFFGNLIYNELSIKLGTVTSNPYPYVWDPTSYAHQVLNFSMKRNFIDHSEVSTWSLKEFEFIKVLLMGAGGISSILTPDICEQIFTSYI